MKCRTRLSQSKWHTEGSRASKIRGPHRSTGQQHKSRNYQAVRYILKDMQYIQLRKGPSTLHKKRHRAGKKKVGYRSIRSKNRG